VLILPGRPFTVVVVVVIVVLNKIIGSMSDGLLLIVIIINVSMIIRIQSIPASSLVSNFW
jgi:hypothetical protein